MQYAVDSRVAVSRRMGASQYRRPEVSGNRIVHRLMIRQHSSFHHRRHLIPSSTVVGQHGNQYFLCFRLDHKIYCSYFDNDIIIDKNSVILTNNFTR